MITITQELAQYRSEFEQLVVGWNALASADRKRQWAKYLDMEDEGGAGWHPFGSLLVNPYSEGWCPLGGVGRDAEGFLTAAQLAAA